ncbi:MAG: D-aminoacylase [Gemmatimonadetes bacterium]|nr:D-aminoacylase [Gemmatimonadota bacterium]
MKTYHRFVHAGLWVAVALGLGVACAPPAAQQEQYDLIIKDGFVLDGSGDPWYRADIAIAGDRIVAVGDLTNAAAGRTIDARGLYVAPGFIDLHSHAGEGLATPELSPAQPLLAQGITTVVANPDGGGPVDLAAQKSELLRDGLGINVAQYVGHGSVRRDVLGMQDRAPDAAELDRMRELVRRAMEAGAVGLSSGLYYAPGNYAATEEVIELAKVAAGYDGFYSSHIRDESDYNIGVVAAVDEVIRVAREGGLPGNVTHIKVLGPRVWGQSSGIVERINAARAEGIEVWADQYPYAASGSGITGALVPRWAQVGGDTALVRRIDDPAERAKLRAGMRENLDRRGGADRLQFRRFEPDPSIEGKTLGAVAKERRMDPIELAMELLKQGGASFVSHVLTEDDVETFMRPAWTAVGTDGDLVPMGQGSPHPRSYGTYPRVIRRYVLERKVISLEDAIRKMTQLPATIGRLAGRGVIRPGAYADVVVFDLAKVQDKATYAEPHQLAEGMVYVLVNGQLALDEGKFTGAKGGQILARAGATPANTE